MLEVKVHALAAGSHAWHANEKDFALVRAAKTLSSAVKGLFGQYNVQIKPETVRMVLRYQNSFLASELQKPLSKRQIDIPKTCDENSTCQYLTDKMRKLEGSRDSLRVQLVFTPKSDTIQVIPMYHSNDALSVNLNGTRRKATDTVAPKKEIDSRQIAWEYATGSLGNSGSALTELNEASIQNHFEHKPESSLLRHMNDNESRHFGVGFYASRTALNEALCQLIQKEWNRIGDGETTCLYLHTALNLYLNIENSAAMAIKLKKQAGCMKVVFFDPNNTTRHTTLILDDAELIKKIDLKILNSKFLNHADTIGIISPNYKKNALADCDIRCIGVSPALCTVLASLAKHDEHPTFPQ